MPDFKKHIIHENAQISVALNMLNDLGENLTLFAINEKEELTATLTDGDVRRGLLNGYGITESISKITNSNFFFIKKGHESLSEVIRAKQKGIQILPIVNDKMKIVNMVFFSVNKSYLPLDCLIMAGGEGIRLRPLTEHLPKPMLKIGDKPIIEHGIDMLKQYGIENIQISINYLGDKVIEYFGDGTNKNLNISYIRENKKLGTIGSLSLADNFTNDVILVMNSDLLTNINLEDFYLDFINKNADMSVASIPYTVNIPYAIMDIQNENIVGLKEKPNLTFQSNAGIYLIKKLFIEKIPLNEVYNATDLIENLISNKNKVIYYPILGYWLDIGKMDDFRKAQEDVKHIKL
ncbi:MAG: nucleotidyltransferase family protein [Bacteroidota bacterium]|nr:nucleotidyltransferase family protein [Bacteroidota bacterium]